MIYLQYCKTNMNWEKDLKKTGERGEDINISADGKNVQPSDFLDSLKDILEKKNKEQATLDQADKSPPSKS